MYPCTSSCRARLGEPGVRGALRSVAQARLPMGVVRLALPALSPPEVSLPEVSLPEVLLPRVSLPEVLLRVSPLLVLLAACAAPPLPAPEVPILLLPSAPCIPVVERLEHLDQPSVLGFSAVELLARVAGESSSPLIWLPPEENREYTLAYGPESGRSNLRLRVTPAEGQVRYRHELMADNAPDGTECAEGVLDVPVSVTIQSGLQALDETFSARLEASTVYRAQLSHTFPPGRLSGGFALTELSSLEPARAFSPGALSLSVVLWEGGSQGSFNTEIQSSFTPAASAAAREAWPQTRSGAEVTNLAVWPSAEACALPGSSSLPSDAKVLGFSVSDVLEALASEGTRELTWSSGDATALELDFVTPASELCQAVAGSLAFDTTVRMRTADGRLSVEVPVRVDASNEAGTIGEITVQTEQGAPGSPVAVTLTSLRAASGFRVAGSPVAGSPVASSPASAAAKTGRVARGRAAAQGYDEVRVDLDASFRAGLSAGTLTLSGVDADVSSAAHEPGYAESAPLRELESGRWTH